MAMAGRIETDDDRWKRRRVEQHLTHEMNSASERLRLACEDKSSQEYAQAKEAAAIALDRWKQFVIDGKIPEGLEID
jgi:hypothetical protein